MCTCVYIWHSYWKLRMCLTNIPRRLWSFGDISLTLLTPAYFTLSKKFRLLGARFSFQWDSRRGSHKSPRSPRLWCSLIFLIFSLKLFLKNCALCRLSSVAETLGKKDVPGGWYSLIALRELAAGRAEFPERAAGNYCTSRPASKPDNTLRLRESRKTTDGGMWF